MSSVEARRTFEQYEKARTRFVQSVAELASCRLNSELLQEANAVSLLRPLLLDVVPAIRQAAALALGRLANHNNDLAAAVVSGDILPQLVHTLANGSTAAERPDHPSSSLSTQRKAAALVLRAVARHSSQLAWSVVDAGGVDALVACLHDCKGDVPAREAAAWALGSFARHDAAMAQRVADAGAVPLLARCVQEPELTLKRIATSALSDVSQHTSELAQAVIDTGIVPHLAQMILNPDAKLKRHVFSLLSQISKHSYELAEAVVQAGIFPAALVSLTDTDIYVMKNCASAIRDIVSHDVRLAQRIDAVGGVAALVRCVGDNSGSVRLPTVMALGYIASHSENLATSIVVEKGEVQLCIALSEEPEDYAQAAAAWALGQIGRHTPQLAGAVAVAGALPTLLRCLQRVDAAEDLQAKAKKALQRVLHKCVHLPTLEGLLRAGPTTLPFGILEAIVAQFGKTLPHDAKARRHFLTSGGLRQMLELKPEPGSTLALHLNIVTSCFPDEIVRFYSTSYSSAHKKRWEAYHAI